MFIHCKLGHNHDGDPAGGKSVYLRADKILSVAFFQNDFYRSGQQGAAHAVQDGTMILFNGGTGETNSTFVINPVGEVMDAIAKALA